MTRGRVDIASSELASRRGQSGNFLPAILQALILFGFLSLVMIYHVAPLIAPSSLAPALPSVLLREADGEFADADYNLTANAAKNARRAASEALLEASPFYYAAMELDEAAEPQQIISLLDEALKRDPRHYYARLWRARMYYRTGRLPDAVADVERVISIDHDPDRTNDYLNALVDLARDPRSHSFLLERVAKAPPWSNEFIRRANTTLNDEDFLLALASRSNTALNDYVAQVASKGDYDRAFLIWQTSLTEDELLAFSWPVDPRFKSKAGAGAFGWNISSGAATREDDGLYVYFSGRTEKPVASQVMLLGPGYTYELDVRMSGEIDARGGFFQWTLRCLESGDIVASLPVKDVKALPTTFSTHAFLPEEGCAHQSLSLTARPGEYPYPSRITVHEVGIRETASDKEGAEAPTALAPKSVPARP